jgi:hypothetical protein
MQHHVLDQALSAMVEAGVVVLRVDPELDLLRSDAVRHADGVHFLVAGAVHALSIGDVVEFSSDDSGLSAGEHDPERCAYVIAVVSNLTSQLRSLAEELPPDLAEPSEPMETKMVYGLLTFFRDHDRSEG